LKTLYCYLGVIISRLVTFDSFLYGICTYRLARWRLVGGIRA
jgi:hypothetical protein